MPDAWQPTNKGRVVSQNELEEVAMELALAGKGLSVWLLYGEMGSGKTTLIKAIGKLMGVQETMSSPTFSIVNEYEIPEDRKIYHFDLYRLKNEKEVFETGAEEYFYSGDLCLVEWPEKLGSLTPVNHLKIKITPTGPLHRKIEYQNA